MEAANSTCVPYLVNADLTAKKGHEPTVDVKSYMSDVGSLRFVADTTHPGISHIVGLLGRHLHNPSQRHVDALKPIYIYLATLADDELCMTKKDLLNLHATRTAITQHVRTLVNQCLET